MLPLDHGLCEIFGLEKNKFGVCYDEIDVCMQLVIMVKLHYKLFDHDFICHDRARSVFCFYQYLCTYGFWDLFKDVALFSPLINHKEFIKEHFAFEGNTTTGEGVFRQKKTIKLKGLKEIGLSQLFIIEMCKAYAIEMLQDPFM